MPTGQELVAMGLAEPHPRGGVKMFDEGHRLLGDVMRRNAERARRFSEERS